MFKKIFVAMLFAAILVSFLTLDSYACHGQKDKHGKKEFAEKFFKKVHIIFKNKKMLKITDKQKEKIVDLKIETKKELIRKKAEIEITALDIKKELKQDKINLKAVNKLIDKKYDLKKEKMKSLVGSYSKLKGILSKEQKNMLYEMKEKDSKKYHHGLMGKGGKSSCPYVGSKHK